MTAAAAAVSLGLPQTLGAPAPTFSSPGSTALSSALSGIRSTELQTLQAALHQQQQNLQQQLHHFILLQQKQQQLQEQQEQQQRQQFGSNLSATLLQNQVQTAISQANAQIKRLQRRHAKETSLPTHMGPIETPKAKDLLRMHKNGVLANGGSNKTEGNPLVSLALSNLTPIPPTSTPTSLSPPENIRPLMISTSSPEAMPGSVPRSISQGMTTMPSPPLFAQTSQLCARLDLPADENVDLEELEQFAKEFKQRRIKLGKSSN